MPKEIKPILCEREIYGALNIGVYSLDFTFFCKPFAGLNIEALRGRIAENSELYRNSLGIYESYIQDIIPFSFQKTNLPLTGFCGPEEPVPIHITFPTEMHYVAEGRQVRLKRPTDVPFYTKTLVLRESYTAFPTGHIAYHFVLVPAEEGGLETQLDEYEIISLIKLFYQTEMPFEDEKKLRNKILFAVGSDRPTTLDRFAQKRLQGEKNQVNYLRQVLNLVGRSYDCRLTWESLYGGVIYISNPDYFAILQEKMTKEKEAEGEESAMPTDVPAEAASPEDQTKELWKQHRQCRTNPNTVLGQNEREDKFLALAGIIQGLLDFPFIDAAELQDSMDPATDLEYAFFQMHPKMLVAIDAGDRPFVQNVSLSGVSPYRLLPQVFLMYNELLLSEPESLLHELRFENPKFMGQKQLAWMDRLYNAVGSAQTKERFCEHLIQKLSVYRSLFLNYLPNIFRYPTEKALFNKGTQVRGLDTKFQLYKSHLQDLDTLLHDADMLYEQSAANKTNKSNIFMNGMLLLIGALSLLQVQEPITQLLHSFSLPEVIFAYVVGALSFYGLFLIVKSFFKGR